MAPARWAISGRQALAKLADGGTKNPSPVTVLRNIEQKIEALFEGVFGRAFRTNVQPVELARKLAKEMDDHRMVSVSRVYAPNEYSVYLSPADREQFESYEESLIERAPGVPRRACAARVVRPAQRAEGAHEHRLRPRGRRVRHRHAHGAARAGQAPAEEPLPAAPPGRDDGLPPARPSDPGRYPGRARRRSPRSSRSTRTASSTRSTR